MKHIKMTDRLRERAALYALGSLEPHETRAFELHLQGGCSPCQAEVESLAAVSRTLALAPAAAAPRPVVRERLLAAAREPGPGPFQFLTHEEGAWAEIQPGMFHRRLLQSPSRTSRGYLVRLEPGGHIPRHQHAAVEHCYVVEGDVHIAGRDLRAGDYHCADRSSVHDETRTDGGCLLLIVESPA